MKKGHKMSESTRAKMRVSALARVARDSMPSGSGAKKGYRHREETKAKMSATHKKLIAENPQVYARLLAHLAVVRPDIRLIRSLHLEAVQRGLETANANRIGKPLSVQTRAKVSANHAAYRPLPADIAAIVEKLAEEFRVTPTGLTTPYPRPAGNHSGRR